MKANEVPERIWVHELSAKELGIPLTEYHVEYIRADTFIDKVCERLEPILKNYAGYYVGNDILRDFKNDITKEIYEYNR